MKISIIVSAYNNRSGLLKSYLSGLLNQGVSNNIYKITGFKGKAFI